VIESQALGVVLVVDDVGGPGDIVHSDIGFKVPLIKEEDVVLQIEKVLTELARDPDRLERLLQRGMRYARKCLSWHRKAQIVSGILYWVVRRGQKHELKPARIGTTHG